MSSDNNSLVPTLGRMHLPAPAPSVLIEYNGPNLILRLPLELRQKIYGYFFCRRIPIRVAAVYEIDPQFHKWWAPAPTKVLRYWLVNGPQFQKYQMDPTTGRDVLDGREQWYTKATKDQVRSLKCGDLKKMNFGVNKFPLGCFVFDRNPIWELPNIIDHQSGRTIRRSIFEGPRGFEVQHSMTVLCPRIYGIGVLCVNKQISSEACDVLYGRNTFLFDARSPAPYATSRDDRFYPGPNDHYYMTDSKSKMRNLPKIEKLLRKHLDSRIATTFGSRDPLVSFFNEIGLANASRLRRILIQGHLFSGESSPPRQSLYRACDLYEILPLHTALLTRFCTNLRCLAIHRYTRKFRDLIESSTEQDNIIRKVCEGLPSLRELRLGPHEVRVWGDAVKWEKIVEDRYQLNAELLHKREAGEGGLAF